VVGNILNSFTDLKLTKHKSRPNEEQKRQK